MNIYGDDSCNDEPMSMIFLLRYRSDHFRFSHLSQQLFHQHWREREKKVRKCEITNMHSTSQVGDMQRDTHPPNTQRFVIGDRKSFNTNIRQSIKRWKCLVSLGSRSLARCSLRIKISETIQGFIHYSALSLRVVPRTKFVVVVCMWGTQC